MHRFALVIATGAALMMQVGPRPGDPRPAMMCVHSRFLLARLGANLDKRQGEWTCTVADFRGDRRRETLL
jgi:hypothetical protein